MKHYIILSCIWGLRDEKMNFGLGDWIYWHLLYNFSESQSVFSWTLLPWLPRTRPILILLLFLLIRSCTTCIVSRLTHRKYIRCLAVDMWKPHRKHLFFYCCIYSALHSNGSNPIVAAIFIAAGMCLPSCCLEMGLHVTLFLLKAAHSE
jgi:hypothetical protein